MEDATTLKGQGKLAWYELRQPFNHAHLFVLVSLYSYHILFSLERVKYLC
jgi:hypothetical protein